MLGVTFFFTSFLCVFMNVFFFVCGRWGGGGGRILRTMGECTSPDLFLYGGLKTRRSIEVSSHL